jgi:transposase
MNAAADLPDDVETLQALVLAMRSEKHVLEAQAAHLRSANEDAEARITELHSIPKMLERARYGRRSEVLDGDQHRFCLTRFGSDLPPLGPAWRWSTSLALNRHASANLFQHISSGLKRSSSLSSDLVPVVPAIGQKIGEDVSDRLDVVPECFRVIVARRPRYACTAYRESIVQAPAPAQLEVDAAA